MITREDLEQAIHECQAEREPNSNTCIKLAAFLTIKNYMFSDELQQNQYRYSYSNQPDVSRETNTVYIDSDSEFATTINGMDTNKAWKLMDELMKTLKVINFRLYNSVMQRIEK